MTDRMTMVELRDKGGLANLKPSTNSFKQVTETAFAAQSSRVAAPEAAKVGNGKGKRMRARVTRRIPGQMNKLEAQYASEVLDRLKSAGEILEYWFERFTFKIADDCRYTPDFVVQTASGEMECHETKGYWEDDAKVKIKVAADLFPFRFVAIRRLPKKDGGGWQEQEF